MQGKIIVLIGYPGVGKLSIARKLAEILPHTHVVDNHRCNNVFFPYMDGNKDLKGHRVWNDIRVVRRQLFDFLAAAVDTRHNLIITGFYEADENIDSVTELAERREADLFPVILICNETEWLQRAQTASRQKLFKLTDVTILKQYKTDSFGLLYPNHPNTRELDITTLSADEAAQKIIEIVQA